MVTCLVKPWGRLVLSGENLEWFDFWLNGHESGNRKEAGQYVRWRQLRVLLRKERPANAISWKAVD